MKRRLRHLSLVFLLAFVAVPGTAAATGDVYATFGTLPHVVGPSTSTSFTSRIVNGASSPNRPNRLRITIPSGFSVTASTVTARTSDTAPCVGSNWIADGSIISNGQIRLRSPGGNTDQNLCQGATLTVDFTATAPSTDRLSIWRTRLSNNTVSGNFTRPSDDPDLNTTVDGTPPQTSVTAAPADPTNQTNASFSFSSTESGSTFRCSLDGSTEDCSSPHSYAGPLSEGNHTFSVAASDGVGNTDPTPATFTWRVDRTPPPAPSITSSPANPTASTSASFAFSDAENDVGFRCSLDGAVPSTCSSTKSYGGLAEGSHMFAVEARDTAGNASPGATYTWVVDRTLPPEPTIDAAPDNPSNAATSTFEFSDVESGVTFRCRLDDNDLGACTSPASYILGEGAHTFSVRARDGAGNESDSVSYIWVIDRTPPPPPTLDSTPPDPSGSSAASFSFSDSESGLAFSCRLDGGSAGACASPVSYSGLAEGNHTFTVQATDAAGNEGSSSYTWVVDKTGPSAPRIDSAPPNPTSSSDAPFEFSTTETGVTLSCALEGGSFFVCTSPVLFPLLAEGSHRFTVKAEDAAGNEASASYVWVIDQTAPPAPTIETVPKQLANARSALFGFGDADATAGFRCRVDSGAFAPCVSPNTVSGLADRAHVFELQAVDGAGNASNVVSYAWTVDATPPDTRVTAGPHDPETATTAAVGFGGAEPGLTFQCRLDGAAFAVCTSPKSYAALAPGRHVFSVRSIDLAANVDPTPATWSWAVVRPQAPDTTPPGPATNLEPRVGYHVLKLAWDLPSDEDLDHVKVLRKTGANGAEKSVYVGSGTSYREPRFNNAATYRYRIISYDEAGNASRAVAVRIRPSALLTSPRPGAVLRSAPLLKWFVVKSATYYNLQLFRNGRKVLSIWPSRARLKLRRHWTFEGRGHSLKPGHYEWFVWPGYGPKRSSRFGALMGQSSFVLR
ncbi:MAG: hypothetical protein M3R70_02255 [Actinomycetota bacterium]|nr:hypothetical protein [Actinomycetota bacterium]